MIVVRVFVHTYIHTYIHIHTRSYITIITVTYLIIDTVYQEESMHLINNMHLIERIIMRPYLNFDLCG